jgi:thiosulfate/3-mercaptopyruvate sulfurtransferase
MTEPCDFARKGGGNSNRPLARNNSETNLLTYDGSQIRVIVDKGSSMQTQYWNTLISAQALNERLRDSHLVIVDCRFELGKPNSQVGRVAYAQAHIPGAVYAHLDEDLSGPITTTSGRHPLPVVDTLSTTLGRWGIDGTTQVVAYDADNGAMAAARLWWLLRWLGHEHVAVLDGGFKHWQASGLPVTSSEFTVAPKIFTPAINADLLVMADEVATRIQQADWRIVDARAPERYAGEVEPLDPVAGHVPSAINQPFVRNVDSNGRFLDASVLQQQFAQLLGDIEPIQVVNMCGSGVTACHNVLAMEIAGLQGSKLYAGSWSEWSKNKQHPVATGHLP